MPLPWSKALRVEELETQSGACSLQGHARSAGVRLGEWDTSTDPDCQDSVCAPPVHDIDPETVIIHQDYNSPRFANDIALVKLAQRINFNGVPSVF